MNIVFIPFHDWRKILSEGFRTRDAHFIEEFSKKKEVKKIIVNRPITLLEIFFKKKKKHIGGEVVLRKGGFTLYKLEENMFLIDYISGNIFGQALQKYKWYINSYSNSEYVSFIEECVSSLNMGEYILLSQNVFAYKLTTKLNPKLRIFDAWDNFTKFKIYQSILNEVKNGYKSYAESCDFWISNAKENISFFSKMFEPRNIHLITNGLDVHRFVDSQNDQVPKDLQGIKRPIVGFGGKITQLLDVALINEVIERTADVSFVFVGQILDNDVFKKLKKKPNFHYLGDKHYDEYPNYVKNFDVCIVPYVTSEEQKSGANSIKVYEYLATGKRVVGTRGNGLQELEKHLYLVDTAKEFSKELQEIENNKPLININEHSWESKAKLLIRLFK